MLDHDEPHDPEGPSAADLERFGSDAIVCPSCGEDVYHDASVCHACGEALVDPGSGRPKTWIIVAGAIALVAFLAVVVL